MVPIRNLRRWTARRQILEMSCDRKHSCGFSKVEIWTIWGCFFFRVEYFRRWWQAGLAEGCWWLWAWPDGAACTWRPGTDRRCDQPPAARWAGRRGLWRGNFWWCAPRRRRGEGQAEEKEGKMTTGVTEPDPPPPTHTHGVCLPARLPGWPGRVWWAVPWGRNRSQKNLLPRTSTSLVPRGLHANVWPQFPLAAVTTKNHTYFHWRFHDHARRIFEQLTGKMSSNSLSC